MPSAQPEEGEGRPDVAAAFAEHSTAVRRLARYLVGDEATADDIVQEVFLRLHSGLPSHDPERGTLLTYLMAVCRSRALDTMRSERARANRQQRSAARHAIETWSHVEEDAVSADERQLLADAIDRLIPREREPILLSYFQGMSYQQAAAALGEPEGTVKSRIRSGLAHLRDDLVGRLEHVLPDVDVGEVDLHGSALRSEPR